eukprot:CAMPEP_0183333870 /NCGR_PEP_ID=MMETSP0164_2-20130417/2642_1 /TAXON_ID=221442 /ORGANISM="Coccolithus pelagicus ssp braarudi, Strain PLY182g" /LENGTH=41 /DNA_ID= /DNA_START= /DNA_END= /DNA_ORIENTATION=
MGAAKPWCQSVRCVVMRLSGFHKALALHASPTVTRPSLSTP